MKLGRTRRANLIRRFLLNAVTAGNSQMIQDAVETFDVSRQSIHRHLSELVKMGFLEAQGNTRSRTYSLGAVRSHTATFSLDGLQESDVYSRNFKHIFSDLPVEIEDICHYGFTEMLNNAIDHSQGTAVSIIAKRDQKVISIWMSDNGEGIFTRIARILGLPDPRESLLELSKGKLTTDQENHSGQGIFFTSRVFDNFYINSGGLMFTHHDDQIRDYLLHHDMQSEGTSVYMEIAIDSSKNLKDVFDAFTGSKEDDYAFNTAVVPGRLALYEGARLVSRSQAKRLLNRIERFTNVQFDFEGIYFIGQAFADEVFRVFTNNHPEIDIQPVNVTEDVVKVIKGAIASK